MAKILNWTYVHKKIKEKNLAVFSPQELVRLFGVTRVAASFFVFRNTEKGLLIRLKKSPKGSLYCLADSMPNKYLIANKLYEPSYVSFDTALSFHNIIPETVYAITSATTRATREFRTTGLLFTYHTVKSSIYTGYSPIKYLNYTILMAEPEKALVDYLYFVDLKKRQLHYERLNLKNIRKTKLLKFATFINRPGVLKLIEGICQSPRPNGRGLSREAEG